jgi:hypothetical protein
MTQQIVDLCKAPVKQQAIKPCLLLPFCGSAIETEAVLSQFPQR